MAVWYSIKWLLWIGLTLIPTLFLPWALSRTWVHQHRVELEASPRKLFVRGELGLISAILAGSVIWNLLQSEFVLHTIALGSILLAFSGIMALTVWVECYCRESSREMCEPGRIWRDSRDLALCVLSVATVVQILLDRLGTVVTRP
jgi:hypothetical protein